jgi:hypothetical protein
LTIRPKRAAVTRRQTAAGAVLRPSHLPAMLTRHCERSEAIQGPRIDSWIGSSPLGGSSQ